LPPLSITSVQLLPEECSPGALFVPVPFDLKRRRYNTEVEAITAAVRNGASAALTNVSQPPFHAGVPVIRAVPNTLAVLARLAQFARSGYQGKVIAITGSVGKTTTKDLVHHVLSHAGLCFKTPANHNTISGVCMVTINRPLKSRFTVVEVGATKPGHLRHAAIARPHIGIITNVGLSHLANYGRADDIHREKVSLFDYLEGERIGIVHRSVLDADSARENLIQSKGLSQLVTVGKGSNSDIYLIEATFNGTATEGVMSVVGKPYRFRLSRPGRHFVDSAMFAVAVASVLRLDIDPLIAALATATPSPRRFERYRIATKDGAVELIDDSYNAAPDSVSALLDTLEQRAARRKVFIFGDMRGLGSDSARCHEAIAPLIGRAGVDLLVTVGTLARHAGGTASETINFADADAASAAVPSLLKPGDLVAVKASGPVGLDKVVLAIRTMGDSAPVVSWRIEDEWRRQSQPQ
jgi:UDP-N-acetylmuramoyl-tripeptide--D-alanyl-D-alanine ligase